MFSAPRRRRTRAPQLRADIRMLQEQAHSSEPPRHAQRHAEGGQCPARPAGRATRKAVRREKLLIDNTDEGSRVVREKVDDNNVAPSVRVAGRRRAASTRPQRWRAGGAAPGRQRAAVPYCRDRSSPPDRCCAESSGDGDRHVSDKAGSRHTATTAPASTISPSTASTPSSRLPQARSAGCEFLIGRSYCWMQKMTQSRPSTK